MCSFSRLLVAPLLAAVLPIMGCTQESAPTTPVSRSSPSAASERSVKEEIDEELEFTLQHRRLNTGEHGAWQILHGALAYQRRFPVRIGADGELQSAVDYVLGGGAMIGWTLRPGDLLDPASGRRGLRAVVEPGTKKGQGHTDQWAAILAQCGLSAQQTIQLGGETYTMSDFIEQIKLDVSRNPYREWSWSLIALTSYLPTDAEWTAADGNVWSIERLVQSEIEQDLSGSACGGTHRLIGVAMALNRHLASGGILSGSWSEADKFIQQAIHDARQYQNPDGSFSTQYFQRPGNTPDLATRLGTTGHILEFLTLSMTDEQLRQPWVENAVRHLCEIFRKSQRVALECGALYHAAHGLVLYRERMFGPRVYDATADEHRTASRQETAQ